MKARTLDDLPDPRGQRALVRVDLNVPMKDGRVADATRIERVAPTITELADRGAKVILLAHFGRPEGKPNPEMSLAPVAEAVEKEIDRPVAFAADCVGDAARSAVEAMGEGEVLLLENTRFHAGEEANDDAFADRLAELGDVYVNDAFSAAHRAHASTEGLARRLPAYAGYAMGAELAALEKALEKPRHPVVAIVGGAKVSTKIDLLANLLEKVDAVVIGGGMANTFLAAKGIDVARSLHEPDLLDTARRIMTDAAARGTAIVLPSDAIVAERLEEGVATRTVPVGEVPANMMILDAGPQAAAEIKDWIGRAETLVWNGPLGAFETPPFDQATVAVASWAAQRTRAGDLVSIGGGGDTVAALAGAGLADDFTYVSTAGGAFLEWMEGKTLPGVAALGAGSA